VRREFWGYAADENLDAARLVAEEYRGIRPAPGYPACPDHLPKEALFRILGATANAGMLLTESLAMLPAASVSGFMLSHPESGYFAVGKIGRDQVGDFARRSGLAMADAERWLAPYLAYEPGTARLEEAA
jgi:5-methyltetrahydrofolate--homocysteine methyltransferase